MIRTASPVLASRALHYCGSAPDRSGAPAGDVGPYGAAAYLRDTGKPIPKKYDWNSQEFKKWFAWRYDEWGNRRDNFALADLFGVDYVASHKEAAQILVPQTDALGREFGRFVTFVSPAVEFKLRAGSDAEVLLTKSSVLLYTLSVKSQPYDSGKPAVVRHRVGKGQVIY